MKNLALDDFCNYHFLSGLTYAPDYKIVAYTQAIADLEANDYKKDIWLLDPATGVTRRLTAAGDAGKFVWLNDEEILFPSMRKQSQKDIVATGEKLTVFYRINIHGGEAVEAFSVPKEVTDFKLISAGSYALVCSERTSEQNIADLASEDKPAAIKHAKEEQDYEVFDEIPFWSNGAGYTNGQRNHLYILNDDGLERASIGGASLSRMQVQDGKVLYTARFLHDKHDLTSGVYLYDSVSKATHMLVKEGQYSIDSADFWGDDYILQLTLREKYGNGENARLFVLKNANLDTGLAGSDTTLTNGKLVQLAMPNEGMGTYTNSDSRMGRSTTYKIYENAVYYTTATHVENALRRVDANGNIETLYHGLGTVDGFDIAPSGIVYIGLEALSLMEIYRLENGAGHKLTHINDEIVLNRTLCAPIRLDAQGEASTVEGFVIKPVDFDEGKQYPAVLDIHGGPRTAFGDTYFHEMQFFANRGYFVLLCNPFGSDGRGDEFADLRGRYGTIDYNDLMAYTDAALAAFPQIDANKLVVTGGSYGGFMTNWIIGHTGRFCCAASQRSISNWVSMFGVSDIGYFFCLDQNGADPWSDVDKVWEQSPLKYADQCTTPTLFIHSNEDYRCPLPDGIQMFTALKYHGVPARMCMFKGENHELSRSGKPKHRIRRLQEMIDWFDKYTGNYAKP